MPPTTHRPKINRKELKQPDELTTLFDSAQKFFFANLRQVFISAGVVVAVGILLIGVYYYERYQDTVTSAKFYNALSALSAGRYKPAEEQFKKLAAEEPGRRLGRLSRFYLASAYLNDGNPAAARDALVRFLAEERDPLFTSLALSNLAVAYERLGDFKKAADAYSQAAGIDGPGKARAELGYARMLVKAGDKPGAIAAYRGFLTANPYAEQRQDVMESLALLGAPAVPPSAAAASMPQPVVTH